MSTVAYGKARVAPPATIAMASASRSPLPSARSSPANAATEIPNGTQTVAIVRTASNTCRFATTSIRTARNASTSAAPTMAGTIGLSE